MHTQLAPISMPNDFIVLPIKLSPAKNVHDFDFGRHNINFQRNYTYTQKESVATTTCSKQQQSRSKYKAWDTTKKFTAYLHWKIWKPRRCSFDFDMRMFVNLNLALETCSVAVSDSFSVLWLS